MSPAPGRNEPCPCGSGKKYKKCCLRRQQEADRARAARSGAVSRVLDWLHERFPDEMAAALDDYFSALSAAELERLESLGEGYREMIRINSMEWVLADGILRIGGEELATTDLLLGERGPLLDSEQRRYLVELASRPLRLYDVIESEAGQGLVLRDARDPEADPVRVVERAGSRSLTAGDVIAARLVAGEPRELSGAIYACSGFELRIHAALDELEESGEADPRRAGQAIVDAWLRRLTAPPPEIVDASGDPIALVTDHYEVLDAGALSRALESCPDVEGDPERGWVRLEEPSASVSRSLVAINPGR